MFDRNQQMNFLRGVQNQNNPTQHQIPIIESPQEPVYLSESIMDSLKKRRLLEGPDELPTGTAAKKVKNQKTRNNEAARKNTGEADRANTGEADRANTGEADRANTGETDRANTGEAKRAGKSALKKAIDRHTDIGTDKEGGMVAKGIEASRSHSQKAFDASRKYYGHGVARGTGLENSPTRTTGSPKPKPGDSPTETRRLKRAGNQPETLRRMRSKAKAAKKNVQQERRAAEAAASAAAVKAAQENPTPSDAVPTGDSSPKSV